MSRPHKIHLITGGKYHDFNLARRSLLALLAEDDEIGATCAEDFSGLARLTDHAGIILYTCDLLPTDAEAEALEAFVSSGGRLLALHASNAPIDFTDGPVIESGNVRIPGLVKEPPETVAPAFMALLGSRFRGHLPYQPITINITDHDHDLTRGLVDFTVTDEPYVATLLDARAHILLTARYKGAAPGYELAHITDDAPRPQLYVKEHGAGAVVYCTLGHACGRFDLRPMMDETTAVVGPWENPNYLEILRRGVRWVSGKNPTGIRAPSDRQSAHETAR